MFAVAELTPVRELAARTSVNLQSFAQESMALADRTDFAVDPHLRQDALAEVSRPLAVAVEQAISGRPFAPSLQQAQQAVQVYREAEHSTLAAVARRPLNRIVEDLTRYADLVAPAG